MDEQRHAVNTTDKYETEARQRYAQRADGERDTYIYMIIYVYIHMYIHTPKDKSTQTHYADRADRRN